MATEPSDHPEDGQRERTIDERYLQSISEGSTECDPGDYEVWRNSFMLLFDAEALHARFPTKAQQFMREEVLGTSTHYIEGFLQVVELTQRHRDGQTITENTLPPLPDKPRSHPPLMPELRDERLLKWLADESDEGKSGGHDSEQDLPEAPTEEPGSR